MTYKGLKLGTWAQFLKYRGFKWAGRDMQDSHYERSHRICRQIEASFPFVGEQG